MEKLGFIVSNENNIKKIVVSTSEHTVLRREDDAIYW